MAFAGSARERIPCQPEFIKTPFNKIPSILREKILQDFEIEITEKLLDEERRGDK